MSSARFTHYSGRTTYKYFKNTNLDVKKLFRCFKTYYQEKKKEVLPIKYCTYLKFFESLNYKFKRPKIDQCDFCMEYEAKTKSSVRERLEYKRHRRLVHAHKNLTHAILGEELNDCLILTFNNAQNLTLPKLTACKQFL